MEAHQALSAASSMLQSAGFSVNNNAAFQMGGWSDLELRRGKTSETRAKDVTQCPQQVRIEWDRGRVNVAASVTPHARRTRVFRWSGVVNGQPYAGSNAATKERVYAD